MNSIRITKSRKRLTKKSRNATMNRNNLYKGAASAYPNTLTVDLDSSQTINNVVVKLNTTWGDGEARGHRFGSFQYQYPQYYL